MDEEYHLCGVVTCVAVTVAEKLQRTVSVSGGADLRISVSVCRFQSWLL